jgi:hypothetical protein
MALSATSDRTLYRQFKQCGSKAYYPTIAQALTKGQRVYACHQCGGFYRTMRVLSVASQAYLIRRISGEVTPGRITEYNDLVSGF